MTTLAVENEMATAQELTPEHPAFRLVLRGNTYPFEQLDPSWLLALPHGEYCRRLMASPHARSHLQNYLSRYYAWLEDYDFDPSCLSYRVALLPGPVLKRLLLFLGVWHFSASIRTLIGVDQVKKMKANLGEELYTFAIKRAPFIASTKASQPAALGTRAFDDLTSYFQQAGLILMFKHLGHLPNGIKMRLFGKLPHGWYVCLKPLIEAPDAQIKGMVEIGVVTRIIKEVLPLWADLLLGSAPAMTTTKVTEL